jgi:hypothetical protein
MARMAEKLVLDYIRKEIIPQLEREGWWKVILVE